MHYSKVMENTEKTQPSIFQPTEAELIRAEGQLLERRKEHREASDEFDRFIGTCESYGSYPVVRPEYSSIDVKINAVTLDGQNKRGSNEF